MNELEMIRASDLEMLRRLESHLIYVDEETPRLVSQELRDAVAARIRDLEAAETDQPTNPTLPEHLLAMGERVGRLMDRVDKLEAKQANGMNVERGLEHLGEQFQKHSHHQRDAGQCYW